MHDQVLTFVFQVLDEKHNVIIPSSKIELHFRADEFEAAREKDAVEIAEALELADGNPSAIRMISRTYGDGRVVKNISDATGVMVGKFLEMKIRAYLGLDRPNATTVDAGDQS